MGATDDSGGLEVFDPLVTGGRREADGGRNLLIGQPGILLKKADNLEVCSVKRRLSHIRFELYSIVGMAPNWYFMESAIGPGGQLRSGRRSRGNSAEGEWRGPR